MPDPATLLAGKTAIVTGASSGIGRATARLLMQCGVRVALVGRSEERLRVAADGAPPGLWAPIVCDVRSDESVRSMTAAAERRSFHANFASLPTTVHSNARAWNLGKYSANEAHMKP